ncbi:unnamed protein product [Rotaria sp. Silwood2]|nr:unnamed protein product [Rotaria sp. Silwood2]CAF2604147.1 unnamed protein product [Rotaria sp. Silwood2]CAF2821174.1 unnamed protein product [Rotaria sp. Silwood2]CAF2974075.1 unnamed protein product [Rotaria sp. Silwood2]
MSFNSVNKPPKEGGNVWSAGSRSRGGFDRSDNDNDGARGGGSYRNNYSRRGGGGYGFRRDNNNDEEDEIEILKDAIFIQNLPKNITRDDIQEAFSTVGPIKTDERSGGPKIWIYKDRMTGEGNGRATVTYEDEETADKAISEYNDQHISSINSVVRVQLAQRRIRNYDNNDRGGFHNNRGFRGGRSNWNNNQSRPGFNSAGNSRWINNRGGFRGRGGGDRGGSSYYGNRGNSYRGSNRGTDNSSNY